MHPGKKTMWVRNRSLLLQRFEFNKATLFSSHMLLNASLHCLLGAYATGFGHQHVGTPKEQSETLASFRSFLLLLLHTLFLWGFWNPAHKETVHYTWGHFRLLQQTSAELPRKKWKLQKPKGHLGKRGARQSAVTLVLWRTAGLTVPPLDLGTTEFIFKENWTDLSHGAVNCKDCTKRLSVNSLLFAGPHSGALSLKDASSRENHSLISEQYKFFSSQAVVWLSIAYLVHLSKYQGNCSSFWT